LQRLYEDRAHREALAEAAYRNATRPELNWNSIAAQWRRLFDGLL
jgi:glycosyltransferase involved in cell wall biosynthesis